MSYEHIPVLLPEVIENLNLQVGAVVIDCTVGGGGHLTAIAKAIGPTGTIIGFDLDERALKAAQDKIKKHKIKTKVKLIKGNFKKLKQKTYDQGISDVDGILLDLGLSASELQARERGFSFTLDGPLDMRFDTASGITAADILNRSSETELVQTFKTFGEEPLAKPIARSIVRQRKIQPLKTTFDLVDVIAQVYGSRYNTRSKVHPATKVFQALRIAVNDEIENLKQVLPSAISLLKTQGRLAIISFHSLEDRTVKAFFKREAKDCVCPPDLPVCRCHHKASLKIITKKPIVPSDQEIKQNSRSRSAKLRVAEKI